MFKVGWLKHIPAYILCIIAFLIPFPFGFAAGSIIALSFFWLIQCSPRDTLINLWRRKALVLPFIIFFLLHAISYFYSFNKAQSLFDIQAKLSFIILPIIIGAGINITEKILENIVFWFINGITAIAIFCIGRALFMWVQTGYTVQFFYHHLVTGLDANAVYQAWYAVISISALMFFPFKRYFIKYPLTKNIITIFHIGFFILLSSKTLIILFIIFFTPIYIRSIFIKRSSFALAATVFLIISAAIIVLFKTNNPIEKRYKEILHNQKTIALPLQSEKDSTQKTIEQNEYNNLTIRLFIWQIAYENISENNLWWYGAGNGDIEDLQNKKMSEHGIENIYNPNFRSPLYNINIHNMYIESLFMIGIPGVFILLSIVIIPFFYIRKVTPTIFFFLFFIISLLFMVQEAALQTQAGIVYYTFIYQIFSSFYYYSQAEREIKVKKNMDF